MISYMTQTSTEQTTGLFDNHDGTWLALTHSASKTFKREEAALVWLARRGYDLDGTRRSFEVVG